MKIRLKTLCEALLEAGLLCEESLCEKKHNKGKVVKFKYRNIEYEREVTHLKDGSEVFYLPGIKGSVSIDDVELIDSEDKKDDDNDNSKNDKKEVDGVENSENDVAAISDLAPGHEKDEKERKEKYEQYVRDVRDKAISSYKKDKKNGKNYFGRPKEEYETYEYKEECKQVSKDLFIDSKYKEKNINTIINRIKLVKYINKEKLKKDLKSGNIIENHYLTRSKESENDGQVFAAFHLNKPDNSGGKQGTVDEEKTYIAIYNVCTGEIVLTGEHNKTYGEFNDLYNTNK